MPKGKVESLNISTKKAIIAGKEVHLVKALFNTHIYPQFPFTVGDIIEFKMNGANFEFLKILSTMGLDRNNSPKGGGGGTVFKNEVFDYPYNFVSLGDKVEKKPFEKGKISGIMECEITTHTPLLIGGGEKNINSSGHPTENFYKENGEYLIPASGLKGAIRNVFDTVTNSCIRGAEKERLEKRLDAGSFNDRKFGVIKYIPTKEKDGTIVEGEMVKILNFKNGSALPEKYRKEGFYKLRFSNEIKKYIFKGKDSPKISNEKTFEEMLNKGDLLGILWVSSTMFNKKNDKIIIIDSNSKEYKLSFESYKDLIYLAEQREKRKEKEGEKFYYAEKLKMDESLREWDPIIFRENSGESVDLTFSEIPRLRYKYSPKKLIPESHNACKTNDNLCPSCRLFGMVDNESSNNKKEVIVKNNSLKGRVYFSDAKHVKGSGKEITNRLIKSLGEPHPSLARFYLTDSAGYDNGKGGIRGRKFYWHHTDKVDAEFESYYSSLRDEKYDKHNSTINCLDKGNKFKFKVKFENLTQKELESLVYSIQLEENMLHKLGKAKAFGFGSSEVKIIQLKIDNGNISNNNFTKNYLIEKTESYINGFRNSIPPETKYWKEFRKIMKKSNELNFEKSPFPEMENKKGKKDTLTWFSKNKNSKLPYILDYNNK
ncbi:MAG: TIGR03986 family type III CRISPR-associated RAMP protein [Cetobacterium sp.]